MTKRYLKTPEEIIKALKEGKEVKDKYSTRFKMLEGFLVLTDSDGEVSVNGTLYIRNGIYIEEPEQLKIEEGKFYKTRAGKKTVCVCSSDPHYRMVLIGDYDDFYFWVLPNGRNSNLEMNDKDIISEWVED